MCQSIKVVVVKKSVSLNDARRTPRRPPRSAQLNYSTDPVNLYNICKEDGINIVYQ